MIAIAVTTITRCFSMSLDVLCKGGACEKRERCALECKNYSRVQMRVGETATGLGIVWKPAHRTNLMVNQ